MSAVVTQMPNLAAARERIAAPVRAHLAVQNLSGSEIARRIGLTQSQVSRRLNGRLPFTSDDLNAIAEELELTVVELIQMPKQIVVGGGSNFLGVTPLHRPWGRPVGPEGLEPPASSVKSGRLTVGPWPLSGTPERTGPSVADDERSVS